MNTDQSLQLLRLFQLVSPSLPVGAYSFSQGMEWAVEDHWLVDAKTTQNWIQDTLHYQLSYTDAPILVRLYDAWDKQNEDEVHEWNSYLLACRESNELRAEDKHMGRALEKLLQGLQLPYPARPLVDPPSFALPYAWVAHYWQLNKTDMLSGYLWGWLENQVLAAIKLVPLGQVAGQAILYHLAELIPGCVRQALVLQDDEIGVTLPLFAIASSRHETQYSRLFRS